ncbi:ectoine/hydroxyectoine ABC transporter permease subunit EhuC [Pseudomonas sp. NPDC089569]|uniref:ectoine/hydroxyectoine ABC transporter permease subunit EhuC n=1 Tax=Pseudomonas sp. NPDC089569 TaxID=3390722 RepID=UPI003D02A007
MGELLPLLLQGTWVTIQVTVLSTLLAIPAAIISELGRRSVWGPVRWLCVAYVEVFRGSSLLVQLFWLFFVLPLPPFNIELTPYQVAVLGMGLHIGAYGAEIMRGAFKAIPKGQYEACIALNFGRFSQFRRIILPQAMVAAIPPGTNLLIELLKNTSLLSLITLADLTFRSRQLDQVTFETTKIYAVTLLIYFILAQIINLFMRRLEKRVHLGRMGGSVQ